MSDNPNRRIDCKFSDCIDAIIKDLDENVEVKVNPALITKWMTKHEQFQLVMKDVKEKLEEILK